jgi:hypothetical protein
VAIKKILEKNMFNFYRAGILCVIMLMPATVWATHPFDVDDTATEGKGNFLFELTGVYAKDASLKSTTETAFLTVGASEHTDISLEVPYLLLDPSPVTGENASGKGDVRLKFKQKIFENEVRQSLAYEIYSDMPTGDVKKGLGTNNVVWGVKLVDTQECHNNAFHLNVGYEVFGRDMKKWHYATNYDIRFGLAAEHKYTDSFRLLAEISGEHGEIAEKRFNPYRFLAGIIYDISKSWYVDLGAGVGLNKDAEDHSVLAGTAWRF